MCHPAGTSDDYPDEIQKECNHIITYYEISGFLHYGTILL